MRPSEIEVRIKELILHGVTPIDALRVGDAMERQLTRLLAEGGLTPALANGADLETVDAGAFTRGPMATPVGIGGEIARAVYGGLGR